MTSSHHRTAPIFLDVDTGVDDALAIAFAVAAGAYLLGISTVAGNVPVELATGNTRRVLAMVGAESVPVHRGASRPLAASYRNAAYAHGDDGLGGAAIGESRAPESTIDAIEAMLGAARRHAGQLVLVALGPLTNIAMALNLRPELVDQVSRLVVMGGAYQVPGNVTRYAEFNAYADPHAAAQVFAAKWNELIAIGLDVTHQTVLSRNQWDRIEPEATGARGLVRQVVAQNFRDQSTDAMYLHDPLAVGVALDPSIVTADARAVHVDLDGDARGRTTVVSGGEVQVATGVDVDRFERWFVDRLGIDGGFGKGEPNGDRQVGSG